MKKDVIIFAGQSNMQGETERLADAEAVENAVEYRYLTDAFVPLCDPVGEDIVRGMRKGYPLYGSEIGEEKWLADHLLGSACGGHTTLVPSFVRAYREVTGHSVVAVHAAKGSTQICDWLPGGEHYAALTEKARAAIRKTEDVGTVAVVWLQGESDALFTVSEQDYFDSLCLLRDGLKKDIGPVLFGMIRVAYFASVTPWFCGKGDARACDLAIMRAQERFCAEYADCPMLTELAAEMITDAQYLHPSVPGHFSAKGLQKLGKLAGAALGKAVLG